MLRVRDVSVAFGDRTVLDRVSLDLSAGEVVGLLGASGSGKSTLLRVIAGILPVDEGTVSLDGVDVTHVPTHRRPIGLVFQDEQLFPHLDVAGNVGFGLRMAGVGSPERAERVTELLEMVGLSGFETRSIERLSGGEAKRVALVRSLAPEPKLLLLDEPLTGLDRDLRVRLTTDLADVLRRTGTTSLWVTHDAEEAESAADRVAQLDELGQTTPERAWTIVELEPGDTHELRRSILRTGTTSAGVDFDGDHDPSTFHLGARVGSELIAISSWMARRYPDLPGRPGYQLRGMATAPAHRGTGVSADLLRHGIERCRADDAVVIWARARSAALAFYLGHGFEVRGDEYTDLATGLPHHDIVLEPS